MKTKSLILGVGAAGALLSTPAAFAQAAVSDPVGYRTDDLASGFNLISPNLSEAVAATGGVDAVAAEGTGSRITDNDGAIALTAGTDYTIQFSNGVNSEVVASTATTIDTADDVGAVTGLTFDVRPTPTLTTLFGAANEAGLVAGVTNPIGADIVWVPNATGGFDQYFYNGTAGTGFGALTVGWKANTTGNTDQASAPVYFTDGIFIQRQSVSTDGIVFVGHVITDDTEVAVVTGFNFVGRVLPVEVTLGESGLQTEIAQGNTNSADADIVWVPNDAGGYDQYFYNGTAGTGFGALTVGWKGTVTGNTDQAGATISSGFVIERKGAPTSVTFAIPDGLDI